MLRIETANGVKEYVPGQAIAGTVAWRLESVPKDVELRLFWYTEGKGTQDTETIEVEHFVDAQAVESRPFSFTLPEAPYSFSGTLISLRWAIELIVDGDKMVERLDILVSPWVTEVKLDSEPPRS
jgi:hypothetical protein